MAVIRPYVLKIQEALQENVRHGSKWSADSQPQSQEEADEKATEDEEIQKKTGSLASH